MTKKKVYQKRYTKKEIQDANKAGDTSIIHSLAVKLMKGEKLSHSEAVEASRIVRISRPAGSIERVNLAAIPEAQNYIFIMLFLSYYGDLEGTHGILKSGDEVGIVNRVASREEKREDVIRLNEYFAKWSENFKTNRHKDQILNLVINEINNDLKEIEGLFAIGEIDETGKDYRRKASILWSKYLYLRVSSIFEDIGKNEVIIDFNGTEIEINPWSMVHILNRHYAESIKQYETGKSFHSDHNLKFFEDPEQLKAILENIGSNPKTKDCNIDYIPFKLNGIIYSIHTKKDEKNINRKKIIYNRLQTFYPVVDLSELNKLQTDYDEVVVETNLSEYIKKEHLQ
jgi:hypothetical protein